MTGVRSGCLLSVAVALLVACGDDEQTTSGPSVSKNIGPEGGEVVLPDGAGVTIPEGALDETVLITVARLEASEAAALIDLYPSGLTAVSELYAFTPHGQDFLLPVEITVPFDSDSSALAMQSLDDEDDTSWAEDEGASFSDGLATLETEHFSIKGVTAGGAATGTDAGEDAAMAMDSGNQQTQDSGNQQAQDSGTDAAIDEDAGDDVDAATDAGGGTTDVLVRFTAGDGSTTITGELPNTPFGVEDNRSSDIFQGDFIFPLSDGTEISVLFCDGAYIVSDGCGLSIPNLPAATYQVFMRGSFASAPSDILTTNSLPFTIADSGSNEWIVQLSNTNLTAGGMVNVFGAANLGAGTYKAIFTPAGGGTSTEVTCTHSMNYCTFMVPSVSAGMYDVTVRAGTGGDAVTSDVNPVVVN